jgi:beta-1,2-mannobiose phosphorylase / 1,2-beta-oligomannan phosphorylase
MVKVKKECILLKPDNIRASSPELRVIGAFNPAAVRAQNGDIILYLRVVEELITKKDKKYFYSPRLCGKKKYELKIDRFEKELISDSSDLDFVFKDDTKRLTFISHFRRIVLDHTGFKVKSIEKIPSFFGTHDDGELGVEDPRITKIGEVYYMTYVGLSRNENISTSLAVSKDLKEWKKLGIIFGEQDKDVVLFPEKIKGEYVAFDRPESSFHFSPPHIWAAYSKDLISWGKLDAISLTKKGDWDYERSGAGAPPIKTKKGWLLIYHGVMSNTKRKVVDKIVERMGISETISGVLRKKDSLYCGGVALFDLENPKKLIAKSEVPILFPMKRHEISIYEDKRIIFPTGAVLDKNGKDLLIFSGAGDLVTTVKKISLDRLFKKLKN